MSVGLVVTDCKDDFHVGGAETIMNHVMKSRNRETYLQFACHVLLLSVCLSPLSFLSLQLVVSMSEKEHIKLRCQHCFSMSRKTCCVAAVQHKTFAVVCLARYAGRTSSDQGIVFKWSGLLFSIKQAGELHLALCRGRYVTLLGRMCVCACVFFSCWLKAQTLLVPNWSVVCRYEIATLRHTMTQRIFQIIFETIFEIIFKKYKNAYLCTYPTITKEKPIATKEKPILAPLSRYLFAKRQTCQCRIGQKTFSLHSG